MFYIIHVEILFRLQLLTTLTLLTCVSLMDGLYYRQESRRLFSFESVLSAKKHSLHIQLKQNCSFRLREVNSKHSA